MMVVVTPALTTEAGAICVASATGAAASGAATPIFRSGDGVSRKGGLGDVPLQRRVVRAVARVVACAESHEQRARVAPAHARRLVQRRAPKLVARLPVGAMLDEQARTAQVLLRSTPLY